MQPTQPPQSYSRGGRRALDRLWLEHLQRSPDVGAGADIAEQEAFAKGLHEFNAGLYFECHETWEEAWRRTPYPERLFLLGLTKVAVGLAHAQRGNSRGARRLVTDGLRCLEPFPARYASIDLEALRGALRDLDLGIQPSLRVLPSG